MPTTPARGRRNPAPFVWITGGSNMAIPHIMPIGFVDGAGRDGVVILLTNPDDPGNIGEGTPVTIWKYNPGTLSTGGIRGEINHHHHHGNRTGPQGQDILKRGAQVYLAKCDSQQPRDPQDAVCCPSGGRTGIFRCRTAGSWRSGGKPRRANPAVLTAQARGSAEDWFSRGVAMQTPPC